MFTIDDLNQLPPFHDPMVHLGVQNYDVIKIVNIPFTVTQHEIYTFVQAVTRLDLIDAHQDGYPIHIIMERSTTKTLDCYVEFKNRDAARTIAISAQNTNSYGDILRMGLRRVDIFQSSQGELCATLFPRAKKTVWDPVTGVPTVNYQSDQHGEGFQGFLTIEEIVNVIRHAKNPYRSTFSQNCQQRVYESMISTLYKFPWQVPANYTVKVRNFLWTAHVDMLKTLVTKVQPSAARNGPFQKTVGLNQKLLMDFIFAGLNVPMFSFRQKHAIIRAAGAVGSGICMMPQAQVWPFQTLAPPFEIDFRVLDNWLKVLNEGAVVIFENNIPHGYEEFVSVAFDEQNCFYVALSDVGRSLSFKELISIELGLMQKIVEQGRYEWCALNSMRFRPLDYVPLNLWGRPFHAVRGFVDTWTNPQSSQADQDYLHRYATEGPFNVYEQTRLQSLVEWQGAGSINVDPSVLLEIDNDRIADNAERESRSIDNTKAITDRSHEELTARRSGYPAATNLDAYPRLPSISRNHWSYDRGSQSERNVSTSTQQSFFSTNGNRQASLYMTPSRTQTAHSREQHSGRGSGTRHELPATRTPEPSDDQTPAHDPFLTPSRRRPSISTIHRSASMSPATSDTLRSTNSVDTSAESSLISHRGSGLNFTPGRNIWEFSPARDIPQGSRSLEMNGNGWPEHETAAVDAETQQRMDAIGTPHRIPIRRAVSGDNTPRHLRQNSASDVLSGSPMRGSPSNGMGSARHMRRDSIPFASANQFARNYQVSQMVPVGRNNAGDQGTRVIRRSSINRNGIAIQATIYEEPSPVESNAPRSGGNTADSEADSDVGGGGVRI